MILTKTEPQTECAPTLQHIWNGLSFPSYPGSIQRPPFTLTASGMTSVDSSKAILRVWFGCHFPQLLFSVIPLARGEWEAGSLQAPQRQLALEHPVDSLHFSEPGNVLGGTLKCLDLRLKTNESFISWEQHYSLYSVGSDFSWWCPPALGDCQLASLRVGEDACNAQGVNCKCELPYHSKDSPGPVQGKLYHHAQGHRIWEDTAAVWNRFITF